MYACMYICMYVQTYIFFVSAYFVPERSRKLSTVKEYYLFQFLFRTIRDTRDR